MFIGDLLLVLSQRTMNYKRKPLPSWGLKWREE